MTVNYEGPYKYDTDDVVGVCPNDGGPLINDPTLWDLFSNIKEIEQDLELGEPVIAYCPRKGHVVILEKGIVVAI
jgi:hypothetical protein